MEGERKINVDTKKCAIYCWKSTWMCNLKRRSNVVNLVFVGRRRGPSSAQSLNFCLTFTLIVCVKLSNLAPTTAIYSLLNVFCFFSLFLQFLLDHSKLQIHHYLYLNPYLDRTGLVKKKVVFKSSFISNTYCGPGG